VAKLLTATRFAKNRRSFTLVELLVVVAIIAILSGIGALTFTGVQDKAKRSRAAADLDTLAKAMSSYFIDVGEMPPRGDSCPACSWPCNSSWELVINALVNNDGSSWNGPYLDSRIDRDPWGNYYCYDDNTPSCCGEQTFVCSMGKNGVWESFPNRTGSGALGDDVCKIVTNDGVY